MLVKQCQNGAGGYFDCPSGMSDVLIAKAACESVYDSCSTGSCGSFRYYRGSDHRSCQCNKPIGQYEFIYANEGYITVGEDYGGSDSNVKGNNLFVRKKTASSCSGNSWSLALDNLGGILEQKFISNC